MISLGVWLSNIVEFVTIHTLEPPPTSLVEWQFIRRPRRFFWLEGNYCIQEYPKAVCRWTNIFRAERDLFTVTWRWNMVQALEDVAIPTVIWIDCHAPKIQEVWSVHTKMRTKDFLFSPTWPSFSVGPFLSPQARLSQHCSQSSPTSCVPFAMFWCFGCRSS